MTERGKSVCTIPWSYPALLSTAFAFSLMCNFPALWTLDLSIFCYSSVASSLPFPSPPHLPAPFSPFREFGTLWLFSILWAYFNLCYSVLSLYLLPGA